MFDKIARAVLAARGDEEFVCLWMYVCVCVRRRAIATGFR